MGRWLVQGLALLFVWSATTGTLWAKVDRWTLGGSERPWGEWGTMTAIDDATSPGAIQPKAFLPGENMIQTIGHKWYFYKPSLDPEYREGDPHAWTQTADTYGYATNVLDGNPATSRMNLFRGYERKHWFTVDFGIPVPAYKYVFYPRQEGIDPWGIPYKDDYMKGYEVSGALIKPAEFDPEPAGYRPFDTILERNDENTHSIVEVEFPTRYFRLFRLYNTVQFPWDLAEIEIYGDGFASEARYESKIVDLSRPVNFGKIAWAASSWRRKTEITGGDTLRTMEPAPDGRTWVWVETRSGKDETPLIYHELTDTGGEREVSEKEYFKLAPAHATAPKPHQRGSVLHDEEHWSYWSPAHALSGEEVVSPEPRRYIQFRITLGTENVEEMARLDSLWIETASPVADGVVGEVALLADPNPEEDIVQVQAGLTATFTCDVKADVAPGQTGFDGLAIRMPSEYAFRELQMGEPLAVLDESAYEVDTSDPARLVVEFSSHKITDATPLRVIFDTAVLVFGTRFDGWVYDREADALPQGIEDGDAHAGVGTNRLSVFVSEETLGNFLTGVTVSSNSFTPNGDGVNDALRIEYTLLQLVGEAPVEVRIYDLSGRSVWTDRRMEQNGNYDRDWDGTDDNHDPVPPGLYVYSIEVGGDEKVLRTFGTVAVIY